MMKPLFALALAAALPLAGCVSFNTVNDEIARARIGETATAGPVRVAPLAVMEDSRCPVGTQCVWAGRVRITARIDDGAAVELTQGQPFAAAGGTLTLVEVYPQKRADATLYPDEYRFGFRFTP
jgi:outer membrane lipoprotein SlyB